MSSWSELLDRARPEEHLVQLYGDDDQLLTRNVSRYLGEGLRLGDGLVAITTGEHADAIVRQLKEQSTETGSALSEGRLTILDARTTLDRFMVEGQPDRARFLSVVGSVLESSRQRSLSGRLRAFGEMVGLLWVEGQHAAAALLEQYWNELLAGSTCSLFCAYPVDIFDAECRISSLDAVLRAHTHMCAGPKTLLSSPWATH